MVIVLTINIFSLEALRNDLNDNKYNNMLKLNKNIVPTWAINWVNKTYVLPEYIWYIQTIVVDWAVAEEHTFEHDTVELTSAPSSSITISYFSREQRDVTWNWEVTMWDLIDDVYDEIGRKQISKVYNRERVQKELNKTIGVIMDDVPERSRIQNYSFSEINWIKINRTDNTNNISVESSYPLDIEGSFLVAESTSSFLWTNKWTYYNYFNFDWTKFDVVDNTLVSDTWLVDAIVGHKLGAWIEKISTVYVEGQEYQYVDNRDFTMTSRGVFTTMKDYEWNSYLYLPWNDKTTTTVVKFLPDYAKVNNDEDVLNIEYRYTRVFIYWVIYRILASREDDRWQYYKNEFTEELKKYRGYKAKNVRKSKSRIGFGSTYDRTSTWVVYNPIPTDVYDQYL